MGSPGGLAELTRAVDPRHLVVDTPPLTAIALVRTRRLGGRPVAGGSKKAIVAALCANGGIAVAKFVGFAVTGASSMLAEAIHSVADTGNQALLLLGGRQAKRPESETHPFGYGMARYFWAFVVSVVLFALGSLFAIYEGIEKLRHPHDLESPEWAVGILVISIILEGLSFRTAVKEANTMRRGLSWRRFVTESKDPEIAVVLLEDLGAMIGLALALAGVGLSVVTGNGVFDALGTIAIGVLLGVISVVLSIQMRSLLLGEAASEADLASIRKALAESTHVGRIIHMRTMHLGPDEVLVAAKIELDASLSFRDVTLAIDAAETRMRAAVPMVRVIYLEPDEFDAGRRMD